MVEQKRKNFKTTNKKNGKKNISKIAKQKKVYITPTEIRAGGTFEYKMPVEVVNDLKRDYKNVDEKFLVDYVNDEFGLLGTCIRVIVG